MTMQRRLSTMPWGLALSVALLGASVPWAQAQSTTTANTTDPAAAAAKANAVALGEAKKQAAETKKRQLLEELSGVAESQQQAIGEIKQWLVSDNNAAGDAILRDLGAALLDAKHPDELLELIPQVPTRKGDLWVASTLMNLRVNALVAGGHIDRIKAEFPKHYSDKSWSGDPSGEFYRAVFRVLADAQRQQDVLDMSADVIGNKLDDVDTVEAMLKCRIKAYSALGKQQEALSEAKSLFNVASMKGTADALLTLARQLQLAIPDDKTIVERFRAQQVAGATPSATTQGTDGDASVLAKVKGSTATYEPYLKNLVDEDYKTLLQRGNLLLLMDQPKDARVIFERAYALAKPEEIKGASESIARCMKAEDGTVGRANAWAASIRPPITEKAK